MTTKEIIEFYDTNAFAGVRDVMKICRCSYEKAKKLIDHINEIRRKKNQFIHDDKKVPTVMLFKNIGIDIAQMKKVP